MTAVNTAKSTTTRWSVGMPNVVQRLSIMFCGPVWKVSARRFSWLERLRSNMSRGTDSVDTAPSGDRCTTRTMSALAPDT